MREQDTYPSATHETGSSRANQSLEMHRVPPEWTPTPEAVALVTLLEEDIDRPDGAAIEHAARSLKILSLYSRRLKDPSRAQAMADAMLLHDVPGRLLHGETDQRAELSNKLADQWRSYTKTDIGSAAFPYMHDQVTIGTQAREWRESIKPKSNGISSADREKLNSPDYDGMVNVSGWSHMNVPNVRGQELAELSHRVNVESLLIKAAEMMDNIKYPPQEDSQQLRNIMEVESFYLPMLEAMGYDAMAAEMASTCHIYRLRGQGKDHLVEKAADAYYEYAQQDPADLAVRFFSLSEKPEVRWIVNEVSGETYHGTNCRFAELEIPIGGRMRRVLFRQKSIGSIAKKMSTKGEDYTLMDMFGFQVIVDADDGSTLNDRQPHEMSDHEIASIHHAQTQELATCFDALTQTVFDNQQLQLRSTNGTRLPVFVQGDAAYTQAVIAHDTSGGAGQRIGVEFDERTVPYRVAKVTGLLGDAGLAIEMQMLTEVDRKLARTGETSHAAYKNSSVMDSNDGLRWVQELHRRRMHMEKGKCNPVSRAIGAVALRALKRGLYPGVFAPSPLLPDNATR